MCDRTRNRYKAPAAPIAAARPAVAPASRPVNRALERGIDGREVGGVAAAARRRIAGDAPRQRSIGRSPVSTWPVPGHAPVAGQLSQTFVVTQQVSVDFAC